MKQALEILIWALAVSESYGILRYTDQSCTDLVPRNFDTGEYDGFNRQNKRRETNYKKKRHDFDSVPFRLVIDEKRYRRGSDLMGKYLHSVAPSWPCKAISIGRFQKMWYCSPQVRIEGGYFEGLLLQSRVVSGGELLRGGVSLIGQFRYLPQAFVYLPCFDIPYATVIDRGQPVQHQNLSFVWTAPDTEMGDIKFIASVNRGLHYWIVVSKILPFNPFPISAFGCGTTLGCFRVCPLDQSPCGARDAVFILAYKVDTLESGEVQFTMGGRIPNNNTYVAVAFGEEFDNLAQADMVVCYVQNGRVRIDHLHIDNIRTPPISHIEALELDDSDINDRMLWCRFNRRPFYDYKQTFYQFYFVGNIDYFQPQRFILPPRSQVHTSSFKRNFTHPFNEIIAGASHNKPLRLLGLCITTLLLISPAVSFL